MHGPICRASTFNTARIDHLYVDRSADARMFALRRSQRDGARLVTLLAKPPRTRCTTSRRSRTYECRSRSLNTLPTMTGTGTIRMLEAVRLSGIPPASIRRRRQKCSVRPTTLQNEQNTFYPWSPYAAAKVYSHHITKNYREAYGILRPTEYFSTTNHPAVARPCHPKDHPRRGCHQSRPRRQPVPGQPRRHSRLGIRPRVCRGMWRILQADEPDDYVFATGVGISVREFRDDCVRPRRPRLGKYVKFDDNYLRPTEVDVSVGTQRRRRSTRLETDSGRPRTGSPDG